MLKSFQILRAIAILPFSVAFCANILYRHPNPTGKTIHGAPGNSSASRSRRVVSLRFLGDDAVFARRPWRTSPPYDEAEGGVLRAGQPMRGDPLFPVVWSR